MKERFLTHARGISKRKLIREKCRVTFSLKVLRNMNNRKAHPTGCTGSHFTMPTPNLTKDENSKISSVIENICLVAYTFLLTDKYTSRYSSDESAPFSLENAVKNLLAWKFYYAFLIPMDLSVTRMRIRFFKMSCATAQVGKNVKSTPYFSRITGEKTTIFHDDYPTFHSFRNWKTLTAKIK